MKNLLTHPYKVGTNQHEVKRKYRFWKDLAWISVIVLVTIILGRYAKTHQLNVSEVRAVYITPTPVQVSLLEQEEVEKYIRTVFGRNGNMAVAVAKGECRGLNPYCKLVTSKEHSVCAFQINIKAHFAKIPGKDIFEKEKWLSNSHNCTLMAKVIYDQSGWYPWTSYTSGNYQKYL